MKRPLTSLFSLAVALALPLRAGAGTLSYTAIPASSSDAKSGITSDQTYTSAVAAGSAAGSDRAVGGVTLFALPAAGDSATANDITVDTTTGTLANGENLPENIQADGGLRDVFAHMIINPGATDGSQEEIAVDTGGLTSGKTYTLRIYITRSSDAVREVNLSFAGDGQPPVETQFFNEDDATTSPGHFSDAGQAYSIDYQFTWDGKTAPGVIITQKSGNAPFCLYAVTNQEGGGSTALTATHHEKVQDVGVQSDTFYSSDDLNSHGDWVRVGNYGPCWHPTDVDSDWRPYTKGRWAYDQDAGWTWVSDEPWGWATYHYGRWANVDGAGWCWVPGRVWAPSWVSWRENDEEVGWAPLPPEADFADAASDDGGDVGGDDSDDGADIDDTADATYDIGPDSYDFCQLANLGATLLTDVLLSRDRNVALINNTTNVTAISVNSSNQTLIAGGPSIDRVNTAISSRGGARVPVVSVHRDPKAPTGGSTGALSDRMPLAFHGPEIIPGNHLTPPTKHMKQIGASKIDKGWASVRDPQVRAQLKKKIATEDHSANGRSNAMLHAAQLAGEKNQPASETRKLRVGTTIPSVASSRSETSSAEPTRKLHVGTTISSARESGDETDSSVSRLKQESQHSETAPTVGHMKQVAKKGSASEQERGEEADSERNSRGQSRDSTVETTTPRHHNTASSSIDSDAPARRHHNTASSSIDSDAPAPRHHNTASSSNDSDAPAPRHHYATSKTARNPNPVGENTFAQPVRHNYTQSEPQHTYTPPEPRHIYTPPVQSTYVPRVEPTYVPRVEPTYVAPTASIYKRGPFGY